MIILLLLPQSEELVKTSDPRNDKKLQGPADLSLIEQPRTADTVNIKKQRPPGKSMR